MFQLEKRIPILADIKFNNKFMKKYDKKQPFRFEIKIDVFAEDFDYDVAMKKIVDEVNKLNDGEVIIKEIKGEHTTLVL